MFEINSQNQRVFRFKVNGKEYSVPLLNDMPYTTIKALADVRSKGDSFAIFEWYISDIFEKHAPGSTAALTFDQAVSLLEAYDKECNSGE